MSKMYYVSYETAQKQLNLNPQNENQDRISLAFCNELVKDALEELNASPEEKQEYLETVVLKVFNKYKNYENYSNKQLVEIYSAVKDTLVWI